MRVARGGLGLDSATSPASFAVAAHLGPRTTPVETFAAVAPSYYRSRAPPLPFQHA